MIIEVIEGIDPALLFFMLLITGTGLFLISKIKRPEKINAPQIKQPETQITQSEIFLRSNLNEEDILQELENIVKDHISRKYNIQNNFDISEVNSIKNIEDDLILQLSDYITRCVYSGQPKKMADIKQIYEKLNRILEEEQDQLELQRLIQTKRDIEIRESSITRRIQNVKTIENPKKEAIKKEKIKKNIKEVQDPRIERIDNLERIKGKLKEIKKPGII